MSSLNIRALALTLGVTWAIGIFFLGITAMFGWGYDVVDVLNSFYLGYSPSILGAIIGAIWAFVDGVISGILIGYFYKYFTSCCCKGRKVSADGPKRRK